MESKIKAPPIVSIAILSVVTAIFWIGFEVFRTLTTEPEPEVPPEILASLNPNLDSQTLTKIQGRVYLSDLEIGSMEFIPTETPVPSPTPEATPEATSEEASPEASPSGEATESAEAEL